MHQLVSTSFKTKQAAIVAKKSGTTLQLFATSTVSAQAAQAHNFGKLPKVFRMEFLDFFLLALAKFRLNGISKYGNI